MIAFLHNLSKINKWALNSNVSVKQKFTLIQLILAPKNLLICGRVQLRCSIQVLFLDSISVQIYIADHYSQAVPVRSVSSSVGSTLFHFCYLLSGRVRHGAVKVYNTSYQHLVDLLRQEQVAFFSR